MFTLEQIKAAHSKVKSGADFPAYVQELKALGITSYEHFVSNGYVRYFGSNGFTRSGEAKWEPVDIAKTGALNQLNYALQLHQGGQTDYPTFCKQAAEAGVEKWKLDMQKMTCSYYDKSGNSMLVEDVPTP